MSARIGNSFLVLSAVLLGTTPTSSTMRGDLAMCLLLKKNIDFLTFLRLGHWDLKKNNNNTEINGMKFKRGCFDKIDWNTWIPDWDVNANKRLEIGSAGSFSAVLLFSYFLFSFFFWLYLKLWISCVNDGKRPLLFFLIILPWQLSQTKRRHRRFLSKIQTVYISTVSFGQIKP